MASPQQLPCDLCEIVSVGENYRRIKNTSDNFCSLVDMNGIFNWPQLVNLSCLKPDLALPLGRDLGMQNNCQLRSEVPCYAPSVCR